MFPNAVEEENSACPSQPLSMSFPGEEVPALLATSAGLAAGGDLFISKKMKIVLLDFFPACCKRFIQI